VHNYQRFTGALNAKPLPMIVAGASGYNLRLHGLSKAFHSAELPVKMAGGDGVLESLTTASTATCGSRSRRSQSRASM